MQHSFPNLTDDRVLSLHEAAEVADLSLSTLRRRLADGSGPRVTRTSLRRLGVRVRDLRSWLDACAEAAAA
jgi:predicted DNA-binding transcriptional regulator AlpA